MPLLTTSAGLHVPVSGGGGGAILTYVDWNNATNNASSYNFLNQPIGTADANRWVVVVFRPGGTTVNVSSATIGGSSADYVTNIGNSYVVAANITSGTTATMFVSLDGTAPNMSIHIFRLISATSPTLYTDASATTITSGAQDSGLGPTVPSGGAFLAVSLVDSTSNQTNTWGGTSSPTGANETFPEGSTACNLATAIGTTPGTLTSAWGAGNGNVGYVCFDV